MGGLRALSVLFCVGVALSKPAYKHLAGPPTEFMPPADPTTAVVTSHIRLLHSANVISQPRDANDDKNFYVDSPDFTFVVLCAEESSLKNIEVIVTSPSGKVVKPAEESEGPFGIGGRSYPSRGLFFSKVEHGQWTVRVQPMSIGDAPTQVFTFVTFSDEDSPVTVSLAASSLHTLVGESVQLRAVVSGPTARLLGATNSTGANGDAKLELVVRHPSGKTTVEPMHPDTAIDASNPAFEAQLSFAETGHYKTEVVVQGQRLDGKVYERSAWYWMTAVDKSAELSGDVVVTPCQDELHRSLKAEQLTVNLVLKSPQLSAIPASPPYRVYAEIFSSSFSSTKDVAVAWIGGLSDVSEVEGKSVVSLHLDTSWLQGHEGPFELRNVRVEELDSYSTVTSAAVLELPLEPDTVLRLAAMKPVTAITRQMRQGYHVGQKLERRQSARQSGNTTNKADDGVLLLVHGYCAPDTPFSVNDFTNYRVFEDYKKNRRTSEFAALIAEFGAEHESFGVVTHSQGGLSALDMFAYLSTGLDNAVGERRLQSLASPYRGSPLSGLLAIIGDLLGIGCGDNSDLSYNGAEKWLAGIPMAARSEVYYYTGQYSTGHLINYCVLASNAVLSWPNDGMVEQKRCNLDGGNDMGHSKGQCHSVNMRDPPISTNSERNAVLNSLAAR